VEGDHAEALGCAAGDDRRRSDRIREVARRVGRDVKSVHGDIQALLKSGVLDRADDGGIVFPYNEVHVDFVLRAA
jgi:predicted transcriptional regulator